MVDAGLASLLGIEPSSAGLEDLGVGPPRERIETKVDAETRAGYDPAMSFLQNDALPTWLPRRCYTVLSVLASADEE